MVYKILNEEFYFPPSLFTYKTSAVNVYPCKYGPMDYLHRAIADNKKLKWDEKSMWEWSRNECAWEWCMTPIHLI